MWSLCKKNIASLLAICGASMAFMQSAYSSEGAVSMGGATRIIYDLDLPGISFPISNTSSRKSFLFHGLALNGSRNDIEENFILSPEIMQLDPETKKRVQIVRIGGEYPEDRETLIYLRGHFMPARENSEGEVTIDISYMIDMKLFLRPPKIKPREDAVDESLSMLNFKITDGKLMIENKSPYHMTINSLEADDQVVSVPDNLSMILPFGFVLIEISNSKIKNIRYTLINDAGFSTRKMTKSL